MAYGLGFMAMTEQQDCGMETDHSINEVWQGNEEEK